MTAERRHRGAETLRTALNGELVSREANGLGASGARRSRRLVPICSRSRSLVGSVPAGSLNGGTAIPMIQEDFMDREASGVHGVSSWGQFMGSELLNGDDAHHRFSTTLTP